VTIKLGVLGATGRMGTEACRAIEGAADLDLVARIGSRDSLAALTDSGAQVAVDLTRPEVVLDNVRFCVEHDISVVVGTSGLDARALEAIRGWLAERPGVGVVVAPNFAVGAVLMMRFAAQAARFFESVEIVELHHPDKADAPSGTARRTAEQVASQEVLFGNAGETLSIRHDSLDRASFMPGLLLGVREVRNHPGLTVGLEHLLDL
jgi:4-hydroxy-tetrahydrodipicolinate reductase